MTVATTTLGERGLLRLPASVRDETGFGKGDEMIVIAAGPGRIVLTTRASIQDEVWSAAPVTARQSSLRAERDADNAVVTAKRRRARTGTEGDEDDDEVGVSLLRRLGI